LHYILKEDLHCETSWKRSLILIWYN
jgi:hypothetical protein